MLRTCCVLFGVVSAQIAFAQSAALSVPLLVVKDADGKAVGQVVSIGNDFEPHVVLEIAGTPALFFVDPQYGLINAPYGSIYFSGSACSGDVYVNRFNGVFEESTQVKVVVTGPDASTGTYRVYRSTSPVAESQSVLSYWSYATQSCQATTGTRDVLPAEEVLPNPLEGYHGPTAIEPGRVWTLEGGDSVP
jgi:hypothetical protein